MCAAKLDHLALARERRRRASASSSTVSSTPTFFSSTRSRALPLGATSRCTRASRLVEELFCCKRCEDCGCHDKEQALERCSRCLSSAPESDFALVELRPPVPPRRRHHSPGNTHAWVHPGLFGASLPPPKLPPRLPAVLKHVPHCLANLHACPFYWGRMDARRAELALADARSGSFLLRDSSHADFLFTLSYRWADETKHLRVEAVAPQTFSIVDYVTAWCPSHLVLLHQDYRVHVDGSALLLYPLNRPFAFSLGALCRAVVCSCVSRNDDLDHLQVPASIVTFLRAYCHPILPVNCSKVIVR